MDIPWYTWLAMRIMEVLLKLRLKLFGREP